MKVAVSHRRENI